MRIDRPITASLLLFGVVVFSFFFVAPEYRNFKKLRQELGEKKAEYNAKFDYFSAIAKAYHELEARREELQKIDDALPKDQNMAALVYFLQKKASDSGILLNSLNLSRSSASKDEGIKEAVFTLNVTGSYSAMQNYIEALQKSARVFEVTTISFYYGSGDGGTVKELIPTSSIYSFNMEVKTYTY